MKNNKKKNVPIIKEIFSSRRIYKLLAICCGLSIILGIIMTAAAFISYANDEESFRQLAQEAQIRQQAESDDKDGMIPANGSDHSGTDAGRAEKENDMEEIPDEEKSEKTAETESQISPEGSDVGGSDQTGHKTETTGKDKSSQDTASSLERLMAQNDECIGWISIPGTKLDYPVMHTPKEPLKYINKNFYGKKSSAGVPFLDGRCDLTNSDNLIFYGHRMKNGSMFSCIKKYTGKKFYNDHPTIELTLADGKHTFRIFAVCTVTKSDSWYCFTKFVGEDEFNTVIGTVMSKSLYSTGYRPEYGTRLITLSSCYGSGKNGRIIVIGMEE